MGHIYEQQLLTCEETGWLTLIDVGGAAGAALAASACESMRRALMSLDGDRKHNVNVRREKRREKPRLTHRARVKKASSTPSFIFAEVSMNLIPSSSASSRPSSSVTALLSVQSDLLPIRTLFTPSEACCSMLACHVRMST